jgi:DNA-binding protein H-NS
MAMSVAFTSQDNRKCLDQAMMKNGNLKSMSVDELWELHELVVAELGQKMAAERTLLETRLRQLGAVARNTTSTREGKAPPGRRPYPKVTPKYRNPKNHSETWAGRGKQPRWLTAQLRAGKKLTDFLIRQERD